MKKITIVLVILLILVFANVKKADTKENKKPHISLEEQLKTAPDKDKAKILNKLGTKHINDEEVKIVYKYSTQALDLARKHKQWEQELLALRNLSLYFGRVENDDKELYHIDLMLIKAKKFQLKNYKCQALSHLAHIHAKKKNLKTAFEFGRRLIETAKTLPDKEQYITFLNSYSYLLFRIKNYSKTIQIDDTISAINKEIGKERSSLDSHMLGTKYVYAKDYFKAVPHYLKAIELYKKEKKIVQVIQMMSYVGSCYRKQEKYELAKQYLDKCYENDYGNHRKGYREAVNIAYDILLGQIYYHTEKYQKAINILNESIVRQIEYIKKSIDVCHNLNKDLLKPFNKFLKENYKLLAEIYSKTSKKESTGKYQSLFEKTIENPNKFVQASS